MILRYCFLRLLWPWSCHSSLLLLLFSSSLVSSYCLSCNSGRACLVVLRVVLSFNVGGLCLVLIRVFFWLCFWPCVSWFSNIFHLVLVFLVVSVCFSFHWWSCCYPNVFFSVPVLWFPVACSLVALMVAAGNSAFGSLAALVLCFPIVAFGSKNPGPVLHHRAFPSA